MRERDWEIVRARRAEVEAAEAAERERIDAPIRAAEKVLQENHAKLIAVQRENILKLKDAEVFISPELLGAHMSHAEAEANNLKAVNAFVASCDEYREKYKTTENGNKILDYLVERNGVNIFDAATLNAAFVKLRDLGILDEIPTPEPAPVHRTPVPATVGAKKPEVFQGWDPATDLPITLTKRQVDLLSADEYRRFAKVRNADLDLRSWGPGPKGR
jgi:hypothetical protein